MGEGDFVDGDTEALKISGAHNRFQSSLNAANAFADRRF
jgi:hypothetical protein